MTTLRPFNTLPYGAKFRYQNTRDVWVRIGHNLVASWPCRLWVKDGSPVQSLCLFCHEDNDEDGISIDSLVLVDDDDEQPSA